VVGGGVFAREEARLSLVGFDVVSHAGFGTGALALGDLGWVFVGGVERLGVARLHEQSGGHPLLLDHAFGGNDEVGVGILVGRRWKRPHQRARVAVHRPRVVVQEGLGFVLRFGIGWRVLLRVELGNWHDLLGVG
jgi:hypothetical protein